MPQHHHFRWRLLRDLAVFQIKLAADALRDLLLSPLTFIAALVDLSTAEHVSDSWFYRLLQLGRRSEVWIDLFGSTKSNEEHAPLTQTQHPALSKQGTHAPRPASLDQWVQQLEGLLKEQYDRGGITANAKDAVDRSLDRWRNSFTEPQQDKTPPSVALPTQQAKHESKDN